jgi:hypothetical protein
MVGHLRSAGKNARFIVALAILSMDQAGNLARLISLTILLG